MLIKHKPDDFVVSELIEFEPAPKGPVSVYELRKRKIDTFQALRRIAARTKLPLDRLHAVALKDRQAVTTQLISVEGRLETNLRISGIQLRYLGRAKEVLTADALRGNAFQITVRDLGERDVRRSQTALEGVAAHGLINYFDDQRFGSLSAGQGMVGRDLAQGDYEGAVRKLTCTIGKRDPLPEKRFKTLVSKSWGDWEAISRKWGTRRGATMIQHLRRHPTDFKGALQRLPAKERAIHVFAYQSLIWNESVARYLTDRLPPHRRISTPYVGGRHIWPISPEGEELPELPATWPLISHESELEGPVKEAVEAALREEGLTQARFKIEGIPGCFFKHYDRDLVIHPAGLEIDDPVPDEEREGRLAQTLRFELPPGAYATLLLKRLYGDAPERGDRPRPRRNRSNKGKKGGKKGKGKGKKRKKG